MSVLLDTNILLRSAQPSHPMHNPALDSVAILRGSGEAPCLVPQNFFEFWVVATRPVGENGLGFSVSEAEIALAKLKGLFQVLDDTSMIFPEWEKLVVKYQVSGKNGHDARLVAAMNVHGVNKLLTFNKADFVRYKQIDAVTPNEVINVPKTV